MKPVSFSAPEKLRAWLLARHASVTELLVLLHRKGTGRGGITYPEALDEALCFGWIDGVRRKFDADSYTIRFTPRRPRSIWSQVNIRHAERLISQGRMHASGATAFAARTASHTHRYSFENRPAALPSVLARQFQDNRAAWKFFTTQPPGYQRTITWWIISAKRAETRERRLRKVIIDSAAGRRVDLLAPFRDSG